MAKEDSVAELEHDIRTLEEKIKKLLEAEEPNLGEVSRLQDLLDEKENALEELKTEMAQNSGTDFENAKENENERSKGNREELASKENEIRNEQNEEMEKEKQEREEKEHNDDEREDANIGDKPINDDEKRFNLTEWQLKTGIDIISDEYIKKKYGNELTEEEFKEILSAENVPKIIMEPGKAEQYIKSPEDWENIKTSKSALEQAVVRGDFPRDVNDESYILLQYDKDKIMDQDVDKSDEGYGKIDKDDIYGVIDPEKTHEEIVEKVEQDIEEDVNQDVEQDIDDENSVLEDVQEYMVNGMVAMRAKDVLDAIQEMEMNGIDVQSQSELVTSIVNIERGTVEQEVGKDAFDKVQNSLARDVENPNPINENEHEHEEDDFQPGM